MFCKSKYILPQDIDLMPYPGFYQDLMNEIIVQDLEGNTDNFIMIGVVYLDKDATSEFMGLNPELRRQYYLNQLLMDSSSIEKFSTGTSLTVYNRSYFLIRGGNDEDFNGWGFDDIEFNCRCIRKLKRFPLPDQFGLDYKNFKTITEYKGWKSIYRLFGDMTFNKGIVMFHAWHPVDNKSSYTKEKNNNKIMFEKKLKRFSVDETEPDPLPDMSTSKKTLVFRTNPYVYSRQIQPLLGQLIVADESKFDKSEDVFLFIKKHKVTQVLFHNPYANNRMKDLYKKCRERNIPYFVAERGALRNSVFYDQGGFLADSDSYKAKHWDKPLSEIKRKRVIDYVASERCTGEALEKQGQKIGGNQLKKKLGINRRKKILFIPMQRPSDTVIRYQSGSIGSYNNFIELVRKVINKIDKNWVVVIKKHPLEDDLAAFDGATIAPNDANINDLLSISDSVLLINSGVGVLSMLWEKPVYFAGNAFYGNDKINRKVTSADMLIHYLESGFRPDKESILRFLAYLLFDFYSFGDFTNREVRLDNGKGSRITATVAINFSELRGLTSDTLYFNTRSKPEVSKDSILFDRYKSPEKIVEIRNKSQANIYDTLESTSTEIVVSNKNDSGSASAKINKFKNDRNSFFKDSKLAFLRALAR